MKIQDQCSSTRTETLINAEILDSEAIFPGEKAKTIRNDAPIFLKYVSKSKFIVLGDPGLVVNDTDSFGGSHSSRGTDCGLRKYRHLVGSDPLFHVCSCT